MTKEVNLVCPVCKLRRTMLIQKEYGQPPVRVEALTYQRSYRGTPGYISPRCFECYDKAESRIREETEQPSTEALGGYLSRHAWDDIGDY